MKPEARILKFKGNELRTSADIMRALEAIMLDLIEGNLTPREAKPIQKEINERIRSIRSGMKTLGALAKLKSLEIQSDRSLSKVEKQSARLQAVEAMRLKTTSKK